MTVDGDNQPRSPPKVAAAGPKPAAQPSAAHQPSFSGNASKPKGWKKWDKGGKAVPANQHKSDAGNHPPAPPAAYNKPSAAEKKAEKKQQQWKNKKGAKDGVDAVKAASSAGGDNAHKGANHGGDTANKTPANQQAVPAQTAGGDQSKNSEKKAAKKAAKQAAKQQKAGTAALRPPPPGYNSTKERFCEVCNTAVPGLDNWEEHCGGRRHKNNAVQYERLKQQSQQQFHKGASQAEHHRSDDAGKQHADRKQVHQAGPQHDGGGFQQRGNAAGAPMQKNRPDDRKTTLPVSDSGNKRGLISYAQRRQMGDVPKYPYCHICNLDIPGRENWEEHLSGKRHRSILMEWTKGSQKIRSDAAADQRPAKGPVDNHQQQRQHQGPATYGRSDRTAPLSPSAKDRLYDTRPQHQPPPSHDPNDVYCEVCRTYISGPTNMASHLMGKKHLLNAELQEAEDRRKGRQADTGAHQNRQTEKMRETYNNNNNNNNAKGNSYWDQKAHGGSVAHQRGQTKDHHSPVRQQQHQPQQQHQQRQPQQQHRQQQEQSKGLDVGFTVTSSDRQSPVTSPKNTLGGIRLAGNVVNAGNNNASQSYASAAAAVHAPHSSGGGVDLSRLKLEIDRRHGTPPPQKIGTAKELKQEWIQAQPWQPRQAVTQSVQLPATLYADVQAKHGSALSELVHSMGPGTRVSVREVIGVRNDPGVGSLPIAQMMAEVTLHDAPSQEHAVHYISELRTYATLCGMNSTDVAAQQQMLQQQQLATNSWQKRGGPTDMHGGANSPAVKVGTGFFGSDSSPQQQRHQQQPQPSSGVFGVTAIPSGSGAPSAATAQVGSQNQLQQTYQMLGRAQQPAVGTSAAQGRGLGGDLFGATDSARSAATSLPAAAPVGASGPIETQSTDQLLANILGGLNLPPGPSTTGLKIPPP